MITENPCIVFHNIEWRDVKDNIGTCSIVTIIFIYKLALSCYLQVTILLHVWIKYTILISVGTLITHIISISDKLGCSNPVQDSLRRIVFLYLRKKMIFLKADFKLYRNLLPSASFHPDS